MFGKILYITDNIAHIENTISADVATDLMNIHVIFEAGDERILGEVVEINEQVIKIKFLGEFVNGKYLNGILRKPKLTSTIRIINGTELSELVGVSGNDTMLLGNSSIYKNFKVYPKINGLFSNHLAIFGNSGSGKSCGVARIIQNVFSNQQMIPINANLFIFDAYGEYKNAFKELNSINSNFHYKMITTNKKDELDSDLNIPVNLLNVDDWALLLQVTTHSQLPIIENTLKLVKIFNGNIAEETNKYKNHLISKALLAILFSKLTIDEKKSEIFKIIEVCNTNEFNFNADIAGVGYSRNFSECFEIDSHGNFGESVLITEYILKHLLPDDYQIEVHDNVNYSLKDFQNALEFTLISEGFQNNERLYSDSIILKVRLNNIINSKIGTYFENKDITIDEYINGLIHIGNDKAQIINVNLEDIDDTYAKVMIKILARIIFEYSKGLENRASVPFHLFLEEAHRYIQQDNDTFLLGYNIFDRIAKEGRKYGVLLGIISQRPVDISDTVISQVSNFLIFKMTHPKDIKYIEEMLPNISQDIVEKQKVLQPGTCVCFGSTFKIPMIVKLDMPNPMPYSSNCDISATWK